MRKLTACMLLACMSAMPAAAADKTNAEKTGQLLKDADAVVPEEAAETAILREEVHEALSELTEREREVVNLRYGLSGGKAHTLQELGAHFKVSRERVRQIEGQALRKLRKSGLSSVVDFDKMERSEKSESSK